MADGAPLDEVVDYGERRMRAALGDAARRHAGVRPTCSTRPAPAPGQRAPARIAVAVTVDGDEVTFDFTGTDAQRAGQRQRGRGGDGVGGGVRPAVGRRPDHPRQRRRHAPGTVLAPAGSIVAARPPAAVGAGNVEVSQRVADVCFGALAQVVPERVGRGARGR